jgi:hypothetical protein
MAGPMPLPKRNQRTNHDAHGVELIIVPPNHKMLQCWGYLPIGEEEGIEIYHYLPYSNLVSNVCELPLINK